MTNNIKNLIMTHYAGSISYGTNLPASDIDIRGIFCADEENIRTPFFPIREQVLADEEDGKIYELANYVKLYTDGNPNILESLWVDDKHIIETSEAHDILKSARVDLLSKKVAFTYSGYAISQLKRIKGHGKHLTNPQPIQAPRQIDFITLVHNFTDGKNLKIDLTDYKDGYRLMHYGSNIYGVYKADGYQTYDFNNTLNTNTGDEDIRDFYQKPRSFKDKICGVVLNEPLYGSRRKPEFIIRFNKEEYKQQKEIHKNYWSWKNNRNSTRAKMEEDFGYDGKHSMHLVRLLNMAEEILEDGVVKVYRPDREMLLDIRAGKWKYEELLEYVEGKDQYIRGELYQKSPLPKSPNIKLASKILMQAQDCYWSTKK